MKVEGLKNVALGCVAGRRIAVRCIEKDGRLQGLKVKVIRNNCLIRFLARLFGYSSDTRALDALTDNKSSFTLSPEDKKRLNSAVNKRVSRLEKRQNEKTCAGKWNKFFKKMERIEDAIAHLSSFRDVFVPPKASSGG